MVLVRRSTFCGSFPALLTILPKRRMACAWLWQGMKSRQNLHSLPSIRFAVSLRSQRAENPDKKGLREAGGRNRERERERERGAGPISLPRSLSLSLSPLSPGKWSSRGLTRFCHYARLESGRQRGEPRARARTLNLGRLRQREDKFFSTVCVIKC